jgi:hypothetical protein
MSEYIDLQVSDRADQEHANLQCAHRGETYFVAHPHRRRYRCICEGTKFYVIGGCGQVGAVPWPLVAAASEYKPR